MVDWHCLDSKALRDLLNVDADIKALMAFIKHTDLMKFEVFINLFLLSVPYEV